MNEQLDFGFPLDSKPLRPQMPAGDWPAQRFTVEGYGNRLQLARENLEYVFWPAREIYRRGILACAANHMRMMETGATTNNESQQWPSATLQVELARWAEFVQHCIDMVDGDWDSPGLEYEVDRLPHLTRARMYHCNVGTVIVTLWADESGGVEFSVGRDSHLFSSQ